MYRFVVMFTLVVASQSLNVEEELSELRSIVRSQAKQIAHQGELLQELRQEKTSSLATVAFMTTIQEFSTNYTNNDIVVFNEIIQDTAEAFDPSTGAYTVPVDGLYLFYIKVGAFIDGDTPADDNPVGNPYNAEIVIGVDDFYVANSNCFDGRDYIRNCQLTYPLQLVAGQYVDVRIRSGSAQYTTVQGIQENNFKTISWFGGHLVL